VRKPTRIAAYGEHERAHSRPVASRLVTDAGFEPVVVGPLASGKSFDSSQPILLKAMTARELRAALKLP